MSDPASSGKTNSHRLNSGGSRHANSALFRAVIAHSMRWHERTIAYVERRTAEGLSKREIIRCLKALPSVRGLQAATRRTTTDAAGR